MTHAGDMWPSLRVAAFGLRLRAEAVGEFLRAARDRPGRRELSALEFHCTSLRRRAELAVADHSHEDRGNHARAMD